MCSLLFYLQNVLLHHMLFPQQVMNSRLTQSLLYLFNAPTVRWFKEFYRFMHLFSARNVLKCLGKRSYPTDPPPSYSPESAAQLPPSHAYRGNGAEVCSCCSPRLCSCGLFFLGLFVFAVIVVVAFFVKLGASSK